MSSDVSLSCKEGTSFDRPLRAIQRVATLLCFKRATIADNFITGSKNAGILRDLRQDAFIVVNIDVYEPFNFLLSAKSCIDDMQALLEIKIMLINFVMTRKKWMCRRFIKGT